MYVRAKLVGKKKELNYGFRKSTTPQREKNEKYKENVGASRSKQVCIFEYVCN